MRSFGLSLTVASIAVVAVGLSRPIHRIRSSVSPAASPLSVGATRLEAVSRAENGLGWAERRASRALDADLASLDEFFNNVKQRTPKFAEVVLGWGSKWRFIADKAPFTKGGRHIAFLRQAFDEHLFKPDDLQRAVEQVAHGYGDRLTAIENQMLVKIREDLRDLPAETLPELADGAAFQSAYEAALSRAMARVGNDVTADVATQVVSLVAGEVLTQVAVRMGVSAGVLGVGAGSSWATFGAGLAIGLIVDQLVSWIWDRWADPRGSLSAELNEKLDELRHLIVEGSDDSLGLRASLTEFARRRAELRREAVLGMLGNKVAFHDHEIAE
jgi:hypothetical protein